MVVLKKTYIEETGTDAIIINLLFQSYSKPYHERVGIRYTIDNWLTYNDLEAESFNKLDKFLIKIKINKKLLTENFFLKYAVYMGYSANIDEWDNNNEKNYTISYKDINNMLNPGCVIV